MSMGVLSLAMLFAASGLARMRAQGEVRWAGDLQGGEPYVFRDPRNPAKLVGFEVDLMAALAARLGTRERFIQNDWSNLVPSLERGDFDLIVNGLEDTPALRRRILLSRPYFAFAEQLVVRRGSTLRSLEALNGHRVGTLASSLAHQILRARPAIEVVLYGGQEEPYRDLQLGRTDAVLLDSVIAARYGLTKPDLELADPDVARGTYVIGLRKGDDDLRDAVNTALADLEASGEMQRIYTRWQLPQLPAGAPVAVPDQPPPATFDQAQVMLFVRAAGVTLAISLLAMALAIPLGLLLALARLYGSPPARLLSHGYIELFRGTPVLLQLYILYYGIAPLVHLSAPAAAIVGLALNYGAYEAEVHRAALQAIPSGQGEAAAALGLSRAQALRLVLLPQALRTALPAMTNDLIALLKDSSLVSVITVVELTKQMTITAVDVRSWALPGALCAALYFAMSYPLARLATRLERWLEAAGEEPVLAVAA
jgi:polar amino acid transport system substrate-binding protein